MTNKYPLARTKKPLKVYRDEDGTRLGTMTLCQVCGYAVVLRRVRTRGAFGKGRPMVEIDMWQHVGPYGAAGHDVELPRFVV